MTSASCIHGPFCTLRRSKTSASTHGSATTPCPSLVSLSPHGQHAGQVTLGFGDFVGGQIKFDSLPIPTMGIRIVQINLETFRGVGERTSVARQFNARGIFLVGIQEARFNHNGIIIVESFAVVHSACAANGFGGCCLWVSISLKVARRKIDWTTYQLSLRTPADW